MGLSAGCRFTFRGFFGGLAFCTLAFARFFCASVTSLACDSESTGGLPVDANTTSDFTSANNFSSTSMGNVTTLLLVLLFIFTYISDQALQSMNLIAERVQLRPNFLVLFIHGVR
jgi:hypothetical protein